MRVEKLANVGTNEQWSGRLLLGVQPLIKWTTLDDEKQKECSDWVLLIWEELHSAHLALVQLRELSRDEDRAAAELATAYKNFYGHLWLAYKDRFQFMAKALGFELGFLFQKEIPFEQGLSLFMARSPDLFRGADVVLRNDYATWQKRLSTARNEQEHASGRPPQILSDSQNLNSLSMAESIFTQIWHRIEEMAILMIVCQKKTTSFLKFNQMRSLQKLTSVCGRYLIPLC